MRVALTLCFLNVDIWILTIKGEVTMWTRIGFAVTIAVIVTTLSTVSAETPAPHYGHSELRKMMQDAHSAPQYQALAAYFRSRQGEFAQQAQSEKREWERRSQNVAGSAAKYPRPGDSSKNRYEYLTYEAQQMSQQAAHYESLSSSAR